MPTSLSLADLRRNYYGGGSDAEYAHLLELYEAGVSADDILEATQSLAVSTTTPAVLVAMRDGDRYDGGAAGVSGGANYVNLTLLLVERKINVNKFGLYVANASGNIDVGIYDDDGTSGAPATKLVSLGSTTCPATGARAFTLASTILSPGRYWAALAADNAVATFKTLDHASVSAFPLFETTYRKATSFPLPSSIAAAEAINGSAPILMVGRV